MAVLNAKYGTLNNKLSVPKPPAIPQAVKPVVPVIAKPVPGTPGFTQLTGAPPAGGLTPEQQKDIDRRRAILAPMTSGTSPASVPPVTTTTAAPGVQPLNVASMNQLQKDVVGAFNKGTGPVNPNIATALDRASSAVADITKPYDPNSYKQFMNPYIDEVINRNAANIGRGYNIQRNNINEDFSQAGGFGSTAQGVERGITNEAESRQIGDMDATLRAQGFDTATATALGLYRTGIDSANTQAGQYQNIASGYQGLDSYEKQKMANDLTNKLNVGNQVQNQNQRELDAYFAERDKAFNYPYVNSDYYANILGRYPTGQTTTTTQPGVGAIQGAVGGGLLGNAVANQYKPTVNNLPWTTPQYINPATGNPYLAGMF